MVPRTAVALRWLLRAGPVGVSQGPVAYPDADVRAASGEPRGRGCAVRDARAHAPRVPRAIL